MYEIAIGYEGPTDACLVLVKDREDRREFLIESAGWKVLSVYRNIGEVDVDSSPLLDHLFQHYRYWNT